MEDLFTKLNVFSGVGRQIGVLKFVFLSLSDYEKAENAAQCFPPSSSNVLLDFFGFYWG